ncbi:unnamed protein product, partial [Adineta ricciae]
MQNVSAERSSTDLNGRFLFVQLLLDILLSLDPPFSNKEKFIRKCAKLYERNATELKVLADFNADYRPAVVLEWYTRECFIFKLLNKALRRQNISLLLLFSFFIQDMQTQLKKLQCQSSVDVYRGQVILKTELAHLKNSCGKYIAMNSFLSTSLSRDVALQFMSGAIGSPIEEGLEYVLFDIHATPNDKTGCSSFANVAGTSFSDAEEEVLFSLNSVFRLDSVQTDPTNPDLTIVKMTFCDNNEHELHAVLNAMKKQFKQDCNDIRGDDHDTTPITLGAVLLNMGQMKLAKTIFTQVLRKRRRSSDTVDVGRCCHYIGDVYRQKNCFSKSIQWYKKALKICESTARDNHSLVAKTYLSLGHAYSKTTDWKFPVWYRTDLANWWSTNVSRRWRKSLRPYEKALALYEKLYGQDHACSEIADCYLGLGSVHLHINNFIPAIDNYQKASIIQTKILPEFHPALAFCQNKLAYSFFRIND